LYRMIAIDIDDTLLNDNMLITNRTREAIHAAVNQNVIVTLATGKPEYLEVLHLEGTKGCAIHFLAGYFGIDMSQVIAVGDSWNDHDMIEMAGLGVAMGNAVASLKEKADYVTLTNNDDGVAHVIEKFILKT
jgi:hydroxymethylpyrimidine pyrophosphatase-like HAD family hydrolase